MTEQSNQTHQTGPPDQTSPWDAPPYPRAPLPSWWWRRSLTERRVIAGALVAVLVVGLAAVIWRTQGGGDSTEQSAATDDTGQPQAEPTATPDPVAFVAALPPSRVAIWDQLAECETLSDWASNTGNGFFGGLQFTLETWQGVGGLGQPDQASREEQIMRAEALFELQGWNAWPGCSQELGLG